MNAETPVYLDHAASTPMRPAALEALSACARERFANPSAMHALGQAARKELEAARREVAALVGAEASGLVFTSGATEANNLAIRGVLEPLLDAGRKAHAVTTALEHASVAKTLEALQARGLELTVVPPGADGVVRAEDVLAEVRADTTLVSVLAASNEFGSLQPVEAIGKGLETRFRGNDAAKPAFHVDAVQAVVSTPFDVPKAHADLCTLSAHKIGGPKGVGALAIRKGLVLKPQAFGGGQERGLRSGTENLPGVVGFAAAATALLATRDGEMKRYAALRESVLTALPPGAKALLPPDAPVAPHVMALECPGKENDWIVLLMSREGVMLSAGSACKAGSRTASTAAVALGLDDARARSVIRVSFGWSNGTKDAEACLGALSRALR